jgi:hypothetical protein
MTSLTSRGWGRPSIFQGSANVTQIYLLSDVWRDVSLREELVDTLLYLYFFCWSSCSTWVPLYWASFWFLAPSRASRSGASWGHQYSAFGLRVADGLNSHSLPIEICVKPLSCGIKPMGALAQSAAECRRWTRWFYTRMHEKGVAIIATLLIYYMLRWLALQCAQQWYRAFLSLPLYYGS